MSTKKVSEKLPKIHEQSTFDLPDTPAITVSQSTGRKRVKVITGISFITIVIFLTSLNYFLHYEQKQRDPILTAEKKQASIIAKVSQLIELPSTENPTIATVSDITKLKGQSFFQNAKNGDILLIYPKANEAILYDPAANKILVTGPIASNNQAAVAGASTNALSVSPTPILVNVALYNGTTIGGLTRKIQEELTQTMPSVTVVDNANASRQDYINTRIVDLTGKSAAAAQQLAKVLHGSVGSMPSNEAVPTDADILVILGENQ